MIRNTHRAVTNGRILELNLDAAADRVAENIQQDIFFVQKKGPHQNTFCTKKNAHIVKIKGEINSSHGEQHLTKSKRTKRVCIPNNAKKVIIGSHSPSGAK